MCVGHSTSALGTFLLFCSPPYSMESKRMVILLFITGILFITTLTAESNLGNTHTYKYEIQVTSGEEQTNSKNDKKDVNYRVTAFAHVTPVWESSQKKEEKLLKIELENLEVWFSKKNTPVARYSSNTPLFVEKTQFGFGRTFYSQKDDLYLRNLLKGVASILHPKSDSNEEQEQDVSGICNTTYSRTGKNIEKLKRHCDYSKERKYSIRQLRSASVYFSSLSKYELDDNGDIQTADVAEKVEIASNLWKAGKSTIRSVTKMVKEKVVSKSPFFSEENLEDVLIALKLQYEAEFTEGTIVGDSPTTSRTKHDLMQLAKSYQKYLQSENLAKLSSASAFLKLLNNFRGCSEEDVKQILDNKKLQPIMPQLLDLIAFGGTSTSADTVIQNLQNKRKPDLIERFLLSLSLVTSPEKELIQVLLNYLNSPDLDAKIKASVISALGALIKTASRANDSSKQEVLHSALEALDKGLKNCSTDDCTLMYLRGLRNAASFKTIPLLTSVAERGGRPALEALLALKDVGFHNRITECESFCQKILHQKQDSSTKAVAVEILLNCNGHNTETLKRLLISLASEKKEFTAFIYSKLIRKMEQDKLFRSKVLRLLSDKDVKYAYSWFPEDSSVSFVKPLISAGDVNSTYNVDMEMLSGGLLKRSSFDIVIEGKEEKLPLISVGMFSEGMGSLVGESGSGEESPRAGLELSVLGVALRPYVFFQSSSELMSHVWSGTASEPTPALQGNFLIADHSESFVLQNGLRVNLQLQSALSADLSGAVQISIWNRNSNSQVRNSAAFWMTGSASLETLHAQVGDEVTAKGQTSVDFLTLFDFYEAPYKMCLQMVQPEFKFLIDRRRSVNLVGGKFLHRRNQKRKILIPARSYALHKLNAELCAQMLAEDY